MIAQSFLVDPAFGQSRPNRVLGNSTIAGTAKFEDNFDSGVLSASWKAHPAFKVKLVGARRDGQLFNASSQDKWDHFLAIPSIITSPNVVQLVYGSLSDPTARAHTGIAMRLQKADTTADGYLIHHNFDKVRLWTVKDGVPDALVDEQDAARNQPEFGDTLMVEFTTDDAGHHFRVSMNGKEDAILRDPQKLQGNAATTYAGIMINGNTTNGVDYFYSARTVDTVPPAAVTDLAVVSRSASAISLRWKAPGDDDKDGKAKSYDLRYSTSPLNDANFSDATPVSSAPVPANPGTVENVTVSGLNGGATYYFALKTMDQAGNVSDLSNVVSGATPALNVMKDDFNRPGPDLGANWKGDPNLQIVNGAVQNVATEDFWSPAIFQGLKNPVAAEIAWAPTATTLGTNWCGIVVMANITEDNTINGYFIQRFAQGGKTRLWSIVDSQIGETIAEGASLAPAPKSGSKMRVEISTDARGHRFRVFVDDKLDRELVDPAKLQGNTGPLYAGIIVESTIGVENAIDEFIVSTPLGTPKTLTKVSGDNQLGAIGQQLPEPMVVFLADSSGNAYPNAVINFRVTSGQATITAPPSPDNNLRLEAESAPFTAPLIAVDDATASGGKYLVYPAGPDASATFTVTIQQAGTYFIWTRSAKPGDEPGSWTLSVDGGADFTYDVFQNDVSETWEWDQVSERGTGPASLPQFDPQTFTWNAGVHTVVFKARWSDTRLDKILVTADPAFVPAGKEESGFTTDKNGLCKANLTLGQIAGAITVQASHGTLAPVTFNQRATGGAAKRIEKTNGDGQSGVAGQKLTQPFVVTVRDNSNNPVANYLVTWVVAQGNGKVSPQVSITDVNGRASASLTLGSQTPVNRVEARVPLEGAPSAFTATTISGLASSTSVISGNGQTASIRSTLPNPLVAKVVDTNGIGVANYPVEFVVTRGGGSTNASSRVLNPGFETLTTASTMPANWTPEGSPLADEVKAATTPVHGGGRSLNVNSSRNGVGVAQAITYQANANYTLSFYAKVVSGTARVIWQMGTEEIINLTPSATGADWQFFSIYATSPASGGRNLTFKTNGAGNFFIDDVKLLPSTAGNGQVSFTWTLGDTASEQKGELFVRNGPGQLTGSPLKFFATAKAGAPATFVKASGDNQVGSASQPLSDPFIVKVTDNTGINGVANLDVTFTVQAGGGKLPGNVTTQMVKTDGRGQAQTSLTLGPQTGVENKVQAVAVGFPTPLTFTATAAIPGQITRVPPFPTFGSAGTKLTAPLTVRVSDNTGKRIAGFPVTFTVKQGNGTINGSASASIKTDANGEAKAYPILGPAPGALNRFEATVTLNSNPVSGSPAVFSVTAARLKNLTMISGNGQTGAVGTPLTLPFKAKVLDSLAAGIRNQNVLFKVTAGGGKLNGKDTLTTIKTDSLGIANVVLTLGPKAATNNNKVQASTNPALSGSPLTFLASAIVGAPSKLAKVSGDSISGVVGNPLPAPFVAKVTDAIGNPIAGVNVIFTVKTGGGKLSNGATKDTVKTLANGQAAVTLKLGTVSGKWNNSVEARAYNGTTPLPNAIVTFVATAASSRAAAMLLQGGNRQPGGQAGEPLANYLVVKVNDLPGNGVPNHPVTFQVKRGGGHFGNGATELTVATDQNGVAKIRWYLGATTKPDSQIVHALANDGINPLRNAPLKFVAFADPGPPNAEASSVFATPSIIPANGATSCQVTVYIRDQFGNPIPRAAVTLFVSGDGNTVKQPTDPTNAAGLVSGSFTTTRAETKTIKAKIIGGIEVARSASVQATPLAAQTLIPVGGNSQTGNVNTALPNPLSVKVGDKFANGVPNYEVRFKVEEGSGKLYEAISGLLLDSLLVRTNASGLANVSYVCGPTVRENRIRVSAPGLANSPFLFLAQTVSSKAAKMEMASGNAQQGVVGGNLPLPLVVKVMDSKNLPVFGVPVNFSITLGDGLINGLSKLTVNSDAFGEAKSTWQLGPEAGLNVLRAESNDLSGSPIDFEAQANADRAAILQVIEDPVYGNVNNPSNPLQVRAVDALGNGVDGVGVIFELIEGAGSLTDNYVVTNNGGFASVQVNFNSQSGPRKIRVSADRLDGSPAILTAIARPLGASMMAVVPRTNNQAGTRAKPVNFPLQAKLHDDLGNSVAGVQIHFVVTKGGGNFGGTGSVYATSDSNGIASAIWTLGASTGLNEARAVKPGLAGSPVTLTATSYDNNFPVINDVPDWHVAEGDFFRFTINASDADSDPLIYSAKYQGGDLPDGAVFDVQTREFTWQTNLSSAGLYELSFFARDNKNGVDEELVMVEVQKRNQPPQIMRRIPLSRGYPLPDTSVSNTGGSFPMRVIATDPDGDILSYRWYRNGVFTGVFTHGYEFIYSPVTQAEFHSVEVLVFDQDDTVRVSWAIKVPVELSSFSAMVLGDQRAQLNWRTAFEQDNIGFNVLRGRTASGPYQKVTTQLIPTSRDGDYSFIDDKVEAGGKYYYKLESVDRNGQVSVFGPVMIEIALPKNFALSQSYPNPFNPSTHIGFELPKTVFVTLAIYNTLGQEVRRLVNEPRAAGSYTVLWDGRDKNGRPAPSGIYHYRIQAGDFVATKKMLMVK